MKRFFGALCLAALLLTAIESGVAPCEAAGRTSRRMTRAQARKPIRYAQSTQSRSKRSLRSRSLRSAKRPFRASTKRTPRRAIRQSARRLGARAQARTERAYFPPVLMYHDIKAIPLKMFDVSVDDFCQQLDWLQENGYKTLSMEEFVFYLYRGQGQELRQGVDQESNFPEKSILITFDDGYQGIYKYAMPELRKRNMKATFFIITDLLGNRDLPGYPYITEEELVELAADERFSIGSHTRTHPYLDKIAEGQRLAELAQSREILEDLTGRWVHSLAYPYGNYSHAVVESTMAAGYEVAFVIQEYGPKDNPARYSIPRIYVGFEASQNQQRLFKELVSAHTGAP